MTEKERQIDFAYKVYTSDTLKNVNDAVVKMFGGSQMRKRFYDIVNESNKEVKEESSQEIIQRISDKLDKLKNREN